MKAWMLLVAWLGVGLVVGLRGQRAPWERALAVAFWPFFLVAPQARAARPEHSAVARLRAALAQDDPAQALVDRLAVALTRQQQRLGRLDLALAEATPGPDDEPAVVAARARSRELLQQARDSEQSALSDALGAVEETATRLWLLREQGQPAEVAALLADLAARLDAGREVAQA